MIDKFREKIFEWCLRHQAKREIVKYSWDKIRSVAILTESNNIDHITQQLLKEGKHVDIFPIPNKKEVYWFTARPKSDIREALQARNYDLLIDLTQKRLLTSLYMAMYFRAGFKTGRHKQEHIYDLIIDTPAQDNPDFLYEQIVKYIQIFSQR